MAKLKTPLLGFKAHGTIGNQLTYQQRGQHIIVRTKPTPTDVKSLPQIYHRWDYQDYSALWHTLTVTEQKQWETNARPYHITGFNLWMKTKLNTLPDLAGRWHLDERSGIYSYDSSKNNNKGTIFGATPTTGKIDYALSFDGKDDYVNCQNSLSLNPTQITIEAWIYPTLIAGDVRRVTTKEHAHNPGGYVLALLSNATAYARINYATTKMVYLNPSQTVSLAWHHLILTYDATYKLKLYLDTQLLGTATGTAPIQSTINHTLIGRHIGGANWFKGRIDQVIIYNRALSPAEIKRHYERKYPE